MNFDPARSTHDGTTTRREKVSERSIGAFNMRLPIFFTPTFDKAHADGTDPCQIVDGFITQWNCFAEHLGEFGITEDFQIAT